MKTKGQIEKLYYGVTFLQWLAVAMMLPLVVLFFQSRGMSLLNVAMLMTVYSGVIVLLEVPTGGLADSLGRKRVAVWAYSLDLLVSVVMLFAFSWPMMVVACMLMGVARALSSGALDAWFVDAWQGVAEAGAELQAALARVQGVTLLALALGSFIGGWLPGLFAGLPADGTAVITPLTIPIVAALCLRAVVLVIVVIGVREERTAEQEVGLLAGVRQVPTIIRDAVGVCREEPILPWMLGGAVIMGLSLMALETFWQPFFAVLLGGEEGQPHGVGQTHWFGIIMGGNFLWGVVGSIMATPLSRLFKQQYGLLLGVMGVVQAGLLMFLSQQTSFWAAVIAFWSVYMVMGVMNSPIGAIYNEAIPSAQRSSLLSVQSLMGHVGSISSGLVIGYIAEKWGVGAAWFVVSWLIMLSLVIYLRVHTLREKNYGTSEEVFPLTQEANIG
ncbi:MAG TPA: MFS transporter [Anaerolineae bacterium]|nr:MFS transporter [Anaerolineae bacterium]